MGSCLKSSDRALILQGLFALIVLGTVCHAAPIAEPLNLGGLLNPGTYGFNRNPNQGIKNHGHQKFWTGAGLYGLGAVTGNQGLKNVGGGLAKLGLLTKVGAHFF